MKNEIIKNNKGSYKDFGITIKSKSIGNPQKKKIKEEVPFMNGTYDFSSIYGEQAYTERELTYVFNIIGLDKIQLNMRKIQVIEWLMEGGKSPLYDNTIPGFYFLAECEDVSFSEKGRVGELTVKFIAYPFKIANKHEGNDIWDDFNFELDYAQETKFAIEGTSNVSLYNLGAIKVTPEVACSSFMNVIKDGISYTFKPGVIKDWQFTLSKGRNDLNISGKGSIEFIFRKEVL